MPQHTLKATALRFPCLRSIAFLIAAFAVSGCATLKSTGSGTGSQAGVYRESAADLTNQAPASMSVPGDFKSPQEGARAQADYHFALAETYGFQGESEKAIEEYKLTLTYDPDSAPVRIRLAAEYVKRGLVSEAVEQAKLAVAKDSTLPDGHLLLGGLYSALKMYDDAIAEYRFVETNFPDNNEAPLFVGAILAEQKKYVEAAKQFEVLAKNPANPSANVAWYYLGRIWLEGENEKSQMKSEKAFQQSIKAKPSYAEATLALGQLYENSHRGELAQKLYQSFQEKYGPNASVAEELGRLYIEKEDYTRAYDQFAIMEAADSTDINVKAKMAFILIRQERYKEAIERLEAVLAIEPNSDKIRFYLGAVYEETKSFKAAIAQYEKVPVGSSYYTESVVHASYLYKTTGNLAKAIETIRAGIAVKDDHAPFYALYASLLDEQKQYAEAVKMLTEAVVKVPTDAQLFFFLGNMQDRVGDSKNSLASMKKVLDIDKDHVQALNFLAYMYAESGQDLENAEKMARRALELQPGDGYILDTLGWVIFKRGRVPEAVRTLEAAYKIQPNESVIAEHLGDAYYKGHMPEKAKKLYMRAAESEPNANTLQKIRTKLVAVDHQIQSPDRPSGSEASERQPASTETP